MLSESSVLLFTMDLSHRYEGKMHELSKRLHDVVELNEKRVKVAEILQSIQHDVKRAASSPAPASASRGMGATFNARASLDYWKKK